MRYIKDETIDLPVPVIGEDEQNLSIPEILVTLAKTYTPDQALTLNMGQLRSLNKVITKLEGDSEDGYFVLDDGDFKVIKQIVEKLGIKLRGSLSRSVPKIFDFLNSSPEEKPKVSPNLSVVNESEVDESAVNE